MKRWVMNVHNMLDYRSSPCSIECLWFQRNSLQFKMLLNMYFQITPSLHIIVLCCQILQRYIFHNNYSKCDDVGLFVCFLYLTTTMYWIWGQRPSPSIDGWGMNFGWLRWPNGNRRQIFWHSSYKTSTRKLARPGIEAGSAEWQTTTLFPDLGIEDKQIINAIYRLGL